MFIKKSFLDEDRFEQVVMAIAHELSHIVLHGLNHPLRECEVAVDLTAMILGYRDFYLDGCEYLETRPIRFWPRCPSRASGWSSLTTPWGFPCFVRFPCVHAAATSPAQRLNVSLRSFHPDVSIFPDRVVGSTCALSFSRIARRSLALRPAHSRCHQFVTR